MVESGDDEYEETEMMVLMELHGLVDATLLDGGFSLQMVGLDEPRPVLQLGKSCFIGRYDDMTGSSLLLKEEQTAGDGSRCWSQMCFVDKRLRMDRMFMHQSEEGEAPRGAAEDTVDPDRLVVGEAEGHPQDSADSGAVDSAEADISISDHTPRQSEA